MRRFPIPAVIALLAALVLAATAASVAFALTHRGGGTTPASAVCDFRPCSPSDVQTVTAHQNDGATRQAEADASITPTIPGRLSAPETLMFCVPLQQRGLDGPGQAVAVVPAGATVVYRPGTCEPDIDAAGAVAFRRDDGSVFHAVPQFEQSVFDGGRIVWTPGYGQLNGEQNIMTGKFIKTDAKVTADQLGQPVLSATLTDDGDQVFGSLTKRIGSPTGGLPLAMFLDGVPLRGKGGQVIAPRVQGEITGTLQTTGLSGPDARSLVALFNSGMLR